MKIMTDKLLARRSKLGKRTSIIGGLAAISVAVIVGTVAVVASFAGTQQLYLSPVTGSVLVGNTIAVQIRVNSGADTVNAVQANLSYDPTKLEYQSIDASGTAFSLSASSVTTTAGSIQLARATGGGEPAVSGDKLFATVTFKALVGSGTSTVNIATGSHVVRSTDAVDILALSAGATYTLTSPVTATPTPVATATPAPTVTPSPGTTPTPAPTAAGTLSLSPAAASVVAGSNVTIDVREDSGTTQVNAIQANLIFDPAKLQYIGVDATGSDFPLTAVTATGNGTLKLTRALNGGDPAVTGSKLVAKVTFMALVTSGTANVAFDTGSVISTLTGTNALKTSTGSVVTITAAGGATPTPAPTATPKPTVTPKPTATPVGATPTPTPKPTATPAPTPTATPSSSTPIPPAIITPAPPKPVVTPAPIVTIPVVGSKKPLIVSGTTKLTTPSVPTTAAITYAVDNKLTTTPVIDTTTLDNGTHTVTATATDTTTGTSQEVKQKITVDNTQPLWKTLVQGAAQSGPYLLIVLVVVGVAVGLWLFMRRLSATPTAPMYADGVRTNVVAADPNKSNDINLPSGPGSGPVGPLGF